MLRPLIKGWDEDKQELKIWATFICGEDRARSDGCYTQGLYPVVVPIYSVLRCSPWKTNIPLCLWTRPESPSVLIKTPTGGFIPPPSLFISISVGLLKRGVTSV